MTEDWDSKTINDSCQIEYGTRVTRKRDGGTRYPVYGGGGETFRIDDWNREDRWVVSRFGMSADCVRFVAGKFFLNDSGLTLSPKDPQAIDPAFLGRALLHLSNAIYKLGRGSAQKNLSVDGFRNLIVAIPPLAEQRRIVAILDEAFAAIAKATENAEQALGRSCLLIQTIRDRALRESGDSKPMPFGSHVEILAGYAFKSANYSDSDGDIALLRGNNIVPGSLRWQDCKKWPQSLSESYSRYFLNEGDVVIAMDRPWVAAGFKRAQITASDLPCLLVQRVARLRSGSSILPRYLYHLISGSDFIKHVLRGQTGTGVPHISTKQIESFPCVLPTLDQQRSIVTMIDQIEKESRRLLTIFEQKSAMLSDLKQSLLHHAFTGQLTAKSTDRMLTEAV